jgi:tubulin-like protein CetZ
MAKLINVPSIFERVGEPVELFEGTYISESDPTITTVLAGLAFPARRLKALEDLLEKNKDRLQNLVNKEYTQHYESQVSWASNLKARQQERKAGNVTSKLSKYQR